MHDVEALVALFAVGVGRCGIADDDHNEDVDDRECEKSVLAESEEAKYLHTVGEEC
jgi:hypothetical protein